MPNNSIYKRINLHSVPSFLWWVLGAFALFGASVVLVYFWRVYFSLNVSTLSFTLGVFFAFLILALATIFAVKISKNDFNLRASICVFLVGILFCFANVPMQTPDEILHFTRSYQIGSGYFDFNKDRAMPDDVNALLDAFPANYNHGVKYQGFEMASSAFEKYENNLQGLDDGTLVLVDKKSGDDNEIVKHYEPLNFLVLPYIPQAIGVFLAKLFGFSALGTLYGARLVNMLFYAIIAYFTLKNCDKYKAVFLSFLFLPLGVFFGASTSYDSLLLILGLYLLSFLAKDKITTKDLILFILVCAFVSGTKTNNIILAMILLCIPKEKWHTKYKKWQVITAFAIFAFIFIQGMAFYTNIFSSGYTAEDSARWQDTVVPASQLQFVLANPLRFFAVILGTLYENSGYLFDMGNFGWTDLPLPLVGGFSAVMLFLGSVLGVNRKENTSLLSKTSLLTMAIIYVGSVVTGLYLLWTPVGMVRVIGLQSRYFMPAYTMLFLLLSMILSKIIVPKLGEDKNIKIAFWVFYVFAIFSAILLFQSSFIGQWLLKGESSLWVLLSA